MKNFKFIHDEIHGRDFPKVETILNLREDLNLFQLFGLLREHKESEGQTSIDIFQVWEEQSNGEWIRIRGDYNRGVKGEPLHTDKLYYYQMSKNPSDQDPLRNMWVACGRVNRDTQGFYKQHFSRNYHNGTKNDCDNCKVVIVRGFFGNVADRDARKIRAEDIVEKYNF